MKKTGLMLALLVFLAGCSAQPEQITIESDVELHGEKADMSGYYWLEDEDHPFIEISAQESIRLFTEEGSGILYYGYVGCPFCERAVPELSKAAKDSGVTVYYIDVYHPDNTYEIYQELFKYIDPVLVDSDKGKQFKVPLVIAVNHGEIVGSQLALVDGYQIESESSQMNKSQKKELRNIYLDLFRKAAE
ncbi:MAG: glutaredoxin family protein [Solobacterium sp.]|nr:glutaredoxin family protein [Solobacterium sp.]